VRTREARLYSATDGARPVPSAFVSAGPILREVRTLLARRQPALAYLIGISVVGTAFDAGVAALRHQFHSFSAFSRVEFDNVVIWRAIASLRDAPILVSLVVLLSVPLGALITGWLYACFLVAFGEGRYSLRAPRRTILRLTIYLLALQVVSIGLLGLADNGKAGVTLLLQLGLAPLTLYPAYAIVFDDVGPVAGVVRGLRVFRARPRESILVVFTLFLVGGLAVIAFANGFTDASHVQPSYLAAWVLVSVLLDFLNDALLLPLYRATPLSEGGSADPSEATRSTEASD
jgi:hypothetical protein